MLSGGRTFHPNMPNFLLPYQMSLLSFISGKKTYIIGACTILYAVTGYVIGQVEQQTAMEMIFLGLGMMGLRAGIAKQ